MDDGAGLKPDIGLQMFRDYSKGFGFILAVAIGLGVLGWGLLWLIGANIEPGESVRIVLNLTLIALLTIGGQMVFAPIIDAVTEEKKSQPAARKLNIMHGLGALSAWSMAYYVGPQALDYFDQKEHEVECETVWEKKIGPIRFSSSTCDE